MFNAKLTKGLNMNFFKLSLVTVSLLFIGCGSDSKSESTVDDTKIETVADAQKNFKALSAFTGVGSSIGKSRTTNFKTSSIQLNKLQQGQKQCTGGGTVNFSISEDEKTTEITYDNCKISGAFYDGTMKIIDNTGYSKIEITKYTYSDSSGSGYINITMEEKTLNDISTTTLNGVIKQKSNNGEIKNISVSNMKLVEKDTSSESWTTIDGGMSIESKCFTGKYTFKTVEKLVDATDGSDNVESGILKLNGAIYTFNNPDVTIKVGSSTETILQSELEKRFQTESVCKE